jgi:hypothetical protein
MKEYAAMLKMNVGTFCSRLVKAYASGKLNADEILGADGRLTARAIRVIQQG